MRPWLAAVLMVVGVALLIGGLAVTVLRVAAPEESAIPVDPKATEQPPTASFLYGTQVAPPAPSNDLPIIMPIMAIGETVSVQEVPPTIQPSPTLSSDTATPFFVFVPKNSPTPRIRATSRAATATAAVITPTVTPIDSPTPTAPAAVAYPPDRIQIPAIGLNAPVLPIGWHTVDVDDQAVNRWNVPDQFASGWHRTSATLGQPGNTVLNGHHNVWGQVFGRLVDVTAGHPLSLWSGTQEFRYRVVQTMILPEDGQPLETRLNNARWLLPSPDERVTLITCWPPNGNSHRLVVIALPIE